MNVVVMGKQPWVSDAKVPPKLQTKLLRRPLSEYDIIQRILLCKGKSATPSSICMNVNGRWKAKDIATVMQSLADKGVGSFSRIPSSPSGKCFCKKAPSEISATFLALQRVPLKLYAERYAIVVPKDTKSTFSSHRVASIVGFSNTKP